MQLVRLEYDRCKNFYAAILFAILLLVQRLIDTTFFFIISTLSTL